MKYKIGDKFWRVNKVFNRLTGTQKKLTMTDANGNEWHRYDKPSVDFTLTEVEIVGSFEAIISGHNMWNEEEYLDRYAIKIDNTYDDVCEDELDGDHQGHYTSYWHNKEDAEAYIKEQHEYHNG